VSSYQQKFATNKQLEADVIIRNPCCVVLLRFTQSQFAVNLLESNIDVTAASFAHLHK
jgi:hypothetical protein